MLPPRSLCYRRERARSSHEHYQRALTSNEIKLRRKYANIAGLQLADVLAHPIKQECLMEREKIPDPGAVFGKQLAKSVSAKFNHHEQQGQVPGYGKVWL